MLFFQKNNSSNAQALINLNLLTNACANDSKNHLRHILSYLERRAFLTDFDQAMFISLVPLQNKLKFEFSWMTLITARVGQGN